MFEVRSSVSFGRFVRNSKFDCWRTNSRLGKFEIRFWQSNFTENTDMFQCMYMHYAVCTKVRSSKFGRSEFCRGKYSSNIIKGQRFLLLSAGEKFLRAQRVLASLLSKHVEVRPFGPRF